jgi:hypothetical protein
MVSISLLLLRSEKLRWRAESGRLLIYHGSADQQVAARGLQERILQIGVKPAEVSQQPRTGFASSWFPAWDGAEVENWPDTLDKI